MKKDIFFVLLLIPLWSSGQIDFDNYFIKKSIRFDFLFGGNAREVNVYPEELKQEPFWSASVTNLIDPFNYGAYRFRIFDAEDGILIYSKGFSTLFQEWQTTPEATITDRTFYQSLIFPFPKQRVRIEIDERTRKDEFKLIYKAEIDPNDNIILKELPYSYNTRIIVENGDPQKKVDIAILAEGYKMEEMDKFIRDAQRVTGYLFSEEPFRSAEHCFNVRAVLTPSVDSGTDIPGEGIYKNTIFNSSFYTFGIERYLTSRDIKSIHNAAASVPYDYIYVLVNTDRYGGGGIYNYLNICSSDNVQSREVFIHEFGHGFAGLGDEYYSSSVAYENFYNTKVEPWEPNLTTLVDFKTKWACMIHDSVPVPTPREQKYKNSVGVYEGGGYQAKGIYSPFIDCRMKSNNAESFCPVCADAIQKVIDFHCK